MSCFLLAKDKWQGEGRPFGTSSSPIIYSLVILTDNGTLPTTYADVQNLEECLFAPGSIVIDSKNNKSYIYDGTTFKAWG